MAQIDLVLTTEARPAYWALLDCARAIAATHGEDAAVKWAQEALEGDFDLFVRVGAKSLKPQFRLIEGGR